MLIYFTKMWIIGWRNSRGFIGLAIMMSYGQLYLLYKYGKCTRQKIKFIK